MTIILQLLRFVANISLILTRWEFSLRLCLVLTPGTISGAGVSILMGVLMGEGGH